ncbi:MAG: hypothetical protein H6637_04115 [Ardenticatenales bacterium]|nr:hypothetical protein [Ardenticatenales bacterium]
MRSWRMALEQPWWYRRRAWRLHGRAWRLHGRARRPDPTWRDRHMQTNV